MATSLFNSLKRRGSRKFRKSRELSEDSPARDTRKTSTASSRANAKNSSLTRENHEETASHQSRKMSANATGGSDIRSVLRRLLSNRPPIETLREKGIYKDLTFGAPLEVVCQRECKLVPKFVEHCINHIESCGLQTQGIYRTSGNMASVNKLKYQVDHNLPLDLTLWGDIAVITSTLKLYFRELPISLLTDEFYKQVSTYIDEHDLGILITKLIDSINKLPRCNRVTLDRILKHLCRVVEHNDENKMTVSNLSIIWGPTLMQISEQAEFKRSLMIQKKTIDIMLRYYSYLNIQTEPNSLPR